MAPKSPQDPPKAHPRGTRAPDPHTPTDPQPLTMAFGLQPPHRTPQPPSGPPRTPPQSPSPWYQGSRSAYPTDPLPPPPSPSPWPLAFSSPPAPYPTTPSRTPPQPLTAASGLGATPDAPLQAASLGRPHQLQPGPAAVPDPSLHPVPRPLLGGPRWDPRGRAGPRCGQASGCDVGGGDTGGGAHGDAQGCRETRGDARVLEGRGGGDTGTLGGPRGCSGDGGGTGDVGTPGGTWVCGAGGHLGGTGGWGRGTWGNMGMGETGTWGGTRRAWVVGIWGAMGQEMWGQEGGRGGRVGDTRDAQEMLGGARGGPRDRQTQAPPPPHALRPLTAIVADGGGPPPSAPRGRRRGRGVPAG